MKSVVKKDFFQDSDEENIKETGEFKNENKCAREKIGKIRFAKREKFRYKQKFRQF